MPSERYTHSAEYKYVLVLEPGAMSAYEYISSQRIAGFDVKEVVNLVRQIAQRLRELHDGGLVHFDVKLRNILLRKGSSGTHALEAQLCDLDASLPAGECRSEQDQEDARNGRLKVGSSAYFSPEVARWFVAEDALYTGTLVAEESIDVWAFGVVLYELCTGRHLFSQDIADDELQNRACDMTRLCVWNCISDADLDDVFGRDGNDSSDEARKAAQHLIRWCLQGNSTMWPTFQEILAHSFLMCAKDQTPPTENVPKYGQEDASITSVQPGNELQRVQDPHFKVQYAVLEAPVQNDIVEIHTSQAEPSRFVSEDVVQNADLSSRIGAALKVLSNKGRGRGRMRYHAFLSHNQSEASGDVAKLFLELQGCGVLCWLDMYQRDLTEDGMRQGVYDSDVFILVLTNSVLNRKFCQKEIGWAIEYKKPILIVAESEERFWPFDYARWSRDECVKISTSPEHDRIFQLAHAGTKSPAFEWHCSSRYQTE